MAERFDELNDRLGFVRSAASGDRLGSGRLLVTPEQVVLEYLPDELGERPRLPVGMPPREIPESLLFVDQHGVTGLAGCRIRRARRKGKLPSWVEIHAEHAIEITEAHDDFTMVNSLRSEIAGLATWTTLTPVVSKESFVNDDDLLTRVVLEAKAGVPKDIGTADGLRLVPYFDTTSSRSLSGGHHVIVEKTFVETRYVGNPVALDDHLRTHQSMQELLVVAYGRPCGQRLVALASSRVPKRHPRTGAAIGDRWRGIISSWRGRADKDAPMEMPNRHTLFDFPDIGASGVRRWVEESPALARVVGPLVLWTFDGGSSVEVEMLQIGVALEALGHTIAVRQGLIPASGSQSFPQYLKRIKESLNCEIDQVIKGSPENGISAHVDYEAWAADFAVLYKQSKHADHPLPDGIAAAVAARSGALLIRMWLAQEFGVDPATINEFARFA